MPDPAFIIIYEKKPKEPLPVMWFEGGLGDKDFAGQFKQGKRPEDLNEVPKSQRRLLAN